MDAACADMCAVVPEPQSLPTELQNNLIGAFIIESEAEIPGLMLKRKDFSI
jgi:hypothetical protein